MCDTLASLGLRPRRSAVTGPDSLTPTERRVAELAAASLTNRQVAEALFVTVKTVETHLARVYQKLGIATRAELLPSIARGRYGAKRSPRPAGCACGASVNGIIVVTLFIVVIPCCDSGNSRNL